MRPRTPHPGALGPRASVRRGIQPLASPPAVRGAVWSVPAHPLPPCPPTPCSRSLSPVVPPDRGHPHLPLLAYIPTFQAHAATNPLPQCTSTPVVPSRREAAQTGAARRADGANRRDSPPSGANRRDSPPSWREPARLAAVLAQTGATRRFRRCDSRLVPANRRKPAQTRASRGASRRKSTRPAGAAAQVRAARRASPWDGATAARLAQPGRTYPPGALPGPSPAGGALKRAQGPPAVSENSAPHSPIRLAARAGGATSRHAPAEALPHSGPPLVAPDPDGLPGQTRASVT